MASPKNPMQRLARLGAELDPGLTDRDVERLVGGLHRRRRQRTVRRLSWAGLVVGLCGVFVVMRHGQPSGPVASVPLPVSSSAMAVVPSVLATVRLHDGSSLTPLDGGSEWSVVEDSPQRVSIVLGRGRARFEVVPSSERVFGVQAGGVTVTVLGTEFTVEKVADRVGVAVTRGLVQVSWAGGRQQLHAHESGWFPPLMVQADPSSPTTATRPATSVDEPPHRTGANPPATNAPIAAEAPSPAPAPKLGAMGPTNLAANPGPRPPLASEAPQTPTTIGADGLLAEADEARLAGKPEVAVIALRRVLREHPGDPRTPLAAFTLGRILLMDVGRPREAAAAFASARAAAPSGAFAEDALAREVEAWAKSGDHERARDRAREYRRLFPHGSRTEAVRLHGGLP